MYMYNPTAKLPHNKFILSYLYLYRMTVKLEDDWETVLATSVVLSGPHEGRPYRSEDFLSGLDEVLEGNVGDVVLAVGPLNKNQE